MTSSLFSSPTVMLEPGSLRYNPCNDLIFPSIIKVWRLLEHPLGAFYMYYAPHDAPGGICLAYADRPEGPWHEYPSNPVIARQWPPHYDVSHVSSPHALWHPTENCLQLFFHGENSTTRQAFSHDGIHFDYGGVAVDSSQVPNTASAFYARGLYRPGSAPRADGLLLWFGHSRTASGLYAATTTDGRHWTPFPQPVILASEIGATYVCAPCPFLIKGSYFVAFHADFPRSPEQTPDLFDIEGPVTDLYACAIAPDLASHSRPVRLLGREVFGPDNERLSDPCLLIEGDDAYLYCTVGRRLAQKIVMFHTTSPALDRLLRS